MRRPLRPALIALLLAGCVVETPRHDPDPASARDAPPSEPIAARGAAPAAIATPGAAAPSPVDAAMRPHCGVTPVPAPHAAVASWIGEHLVVDQPGTVLIARLDGDRMRLLGAWGDSIGGQPSQRARLWVSGTVALRATTAGMADRLELLDVSDPEAPVLLAAEPHLGLDVADPVIVADDDGFAFCQDAGQLRVRPAPVGGHLVIDHVEGWACRPADASRAAGGHLLTWHLISGPYSGPSFAVHRLDDDVPSALVDLSFNPSGVHAYGDIRAAAVSDRRAYIDVASRRYGWILDLDPDVRARVHSPTMPTTGAERLLGVAGAHALFLEGDRVWAMDIEDPEAPRRLTPDWAADEATTVLAAEDDRFVLRRGDGAIAVHRVGEAEPFGWVRDTCRP